MNAKAAGAAIIFTAVAAATTLYALKAMPPGVGWGLVVLTFFGMWQTLADDE